MHKTSKLVKRFRALCLAALAGTWIALGGPAAADAIDAILEAGIVRIAVPQDLPPFGSLSTEGALEGYDVDVAKLLARDLGVQGELVPVRSGDRIPALLTHKADLVVANLGLNPERARAIAFSQPYAPFFSGVFGKTGMAVASPADLAGKRIAVTRGTLEDQELTAVAPQGTEIRRFDDNDATLRAFTSGEVDLVATGNVVIATLARLQPDNAVETKFILRESPASIGIRRDTPELRHWVDVFILHKKLTGELDALARKWFGEPLPPLPIL
jgi:polar amino acid transport system substrate-binding protein